MTGGSCASTAQSALESVKGVKEVSVSLEIQKSVVKYDADVAKAEELIKAVKDACSGAFPAPDFRPSGQAPARGGKE
jgi:copper chaperone CopZ